VEKEKIGFFGGCFNPPSNIHINLALDLIKKQKLDKVIFVPVSDYYKKSDLIEFKHRFTMLKFAIEDYENLYIDNLEENLNGQTYAIDIFKIINEKYISSQNFFIMGSDNYSKIKNWKNYEELKNYNYIILQRDDNEISSTEIRDMIKSNNLKNNILNKKVYNYILENNLYKI